MPAPGQILVKINPPRIVVRKEGWGLTRSASAIRGARLVPVDGVNEYQAADLDEGLWRIPEFGEVMLRPSVFRKDLMENADWAPYWYSLSMLNVRASPVELKEIAQDHLASQPKVFTTMREDLATDLLGLPVVPPGLSGLNVTANYSLVWVASTKDPLWANEAFSVWVTPFGIPSDRASSIMAIAFGQRWCLILDMAGGATLFQNTGTAAAQNWVNRKRFEFAQGGVDHTQPYQVTVIPWGGDRIQFLFSQSAEGGGSDSSQMGSQVLTAFCYECKRNGFTPISNPVMNQTIKTEAAPIHIAVRKDRYSLAFMMARVRYKNALLIVAPEQFDEPHSNQPTVTLWGFFNKTHGVEAPAQFYKGPNRTLGPGANFTTHKNLTWNVSKDTKPVLFTYVEPSEGGVYSPELSAVEYDLRPDTHAVAGEYEISDLWKKLSFRLSNVPDVGQVGLLYDRTFDWANLFKRDATFEVEVFDWDNLNSTVIEGDIEEMRPVMEGAFAPEETFEVGEETVVKIRTTPSITDEPILRDMWGVLNSTSASFFYSMSQRSLGELIEKLLKRAGATDATLDIAPELYSIKVDGWEVPNDFKVPSETASCGDVARVLISLYGYQGKSVPRMLRIRRRNRVWQAYLSPDYDPGVTSLDGVFFMDTNALPESIRGMTDLARHAEGYFRMWGFPEFVNRRAPFNHLAGSCSTGMSDSVDRYTGWIPPKPSQLDDETYWDYCAGVDSRVYGPNEFGLISTLNELHRALRRKYDVEARPLLGLQFQGEWQVPLDSDQIVAVVGRAFEDGSGFVKGEPISYGAFLIEDIGVEITMAEPERPISGLGGYKDDSTARYSSKVGLYSMTYVGETGLADFPMFSTVLPDWGRMP